MKKITHTLNFFRISIIAGYLILLCSMGSDVKIDNSLERWVPPQSPVLHDYKNFLHNFGGDGILLITFYDSNAFENRTLKRKIFHFENQLRNLSVVKKVVTYPPPLCRLKKDPRETLHTTVVSFTPPSTLNPNRPELIKTVRELAQSIPLELHMAGTGVIHQAINEETQRNTVTFLSRGIIILLLLLFVIVRNGKAFLLSLAVSLGGVLTIPLTATLFHIPLNLMTSVLPVLVLFYGTSTSLHILFHHGNFKDVIFPCLLATFTTTIGFAVFFIDSIPVLKDFAILAVSGIFGEILWAMIIFYPHNFQYNPRSHFVQLFHRFPIPSDSHTRLVFIAAALVLFPGFLKIHSDIYSPDLLSPENRSVLDHYFTERLVGNYIPLEYCVSRDDVSAEKVDDWISAVFDMEEINGVISYTYFPPTIDPGRNGYLSPDGRTGRITFFIPLMSTSDGQRLVHKIDKISTTLLPAHPPRMSGYVMLYAIVAGELKNSFIKSIILAFIVIFLFIFLYLQNGGLLLAAMLPNIFPILFLTGIMGWFRIPLNMVTVPMGSLLLGIVVDDTAHFLFWAKKTGNLRTSMLQAGPGMLWTTVILVAGFSIFLLSNSPPIRLFGILSIATLSSAVLGDLFLLPNLLGMMNQFKNDGISSDSKYVGKKTENDGI